MDFRWEQIISCLPTTNPQLAAEYLLAIATSRVRSNQKKAAALHAGQKQPNESCEIRNWHNLYFHSDDWLVDSHWCFVDINIFLRKVRAM